MAPPGTKSESLPYSAPTRSEYSGYGAGAAMYAYAAWPILITGGGFMTVGAAAGLVLPSLYLGRPSTLAGFALYYVVGGVVAIGTMKLISPF